MKKHAIIIICAAAIVAAIAWVPVSRFIAWRHDYAEAEPLVQLVWPMAGEMKRFAEQNGRLPATLAEIDAFSKGYGFSRLEAYHPDFTAQGERIFYLKVNRRFSFEIDRGFTPKWTHSTGVLE
ncbi:MAG: hypothetical protein WCV00_16855 [Verrucomicrobiia bacterium]